MKLPTEKKMANSLRIFGLLLYKNLIVRKRHWKLTLFLEALVPILLFVLVQAVRDYSVRPAQEIQSSTYYKIKTKEQLLLGVNSEYMYLFYKPQNTYTDEIMEHARRCMQLPYERVKGFFTEEEMLSAYTHLEAKISFISVLALDFEQYNTSTIKYKIRHSVGIPTKLFENIFNQYMDASYSAYHDRIAFVQTQICIDESFINHIKPNSLNNTLVSLQRVPFPPYVEIDPTDILLRQILCIFAVIAFLIPLCIEANYAAQEKFIGVNVLMAMNGVKLYQNLLSWLVTGILFSIIYVIPVLVLFKVTFSGNVVPYLFYGNAFIFWLVMTTHIAHLISFGMHIAAYFSKPRFVVITLSIIYTASLSLHGNLIREEIFSVIPYLGILFPNVLLYRLLEEVNAYENKLMGIQWSNMFIVGDAEYGIVGSVGFIFLFSLLGAVLNFMMSVYINAIFPGKYGVPKSPLYFLKCIKKNKVCLEQQAAEFDYNKVDSNDFEPVERGVLIPGIQIRDVKKTYRVSWIRKSFVQALKGVSLDLYKGQITALLGHNGAGKTTLMSILTGVTNATEGNVFINGKSVRTDLESIRNDLGLCPQENMFFPDLNVYEQMEFFGLLKGRHKSRKEVQHNVKILLSKLKIAEKQNVLPSKLSGGQKRRLCLGMALIGDASTVILDEPTSGMDPETRRDTWDIILKMRGEKTILISTHNMEEADILGDRIAIVHGGRLKSYGTALFLKKQYGHGCVEVTLSTKSWCSADKVLNKFDARTQKISADKEKIVLSVPFSDSLPQSLDTIENEKKKLGITGVSVSLITLEQVFLEIVKKEENTKPLTELFSSSFEKLTGRDLFIQTILALFYKKFTYAKKNLSNIITIIALPILSVILMGLSYDGADVSTEVFPLSLDIYRTPFALYSSESELKDTLGIQYRKSVEHFGGTAEDASKYPSLTNGLLDYAINDIAAYRNHLVAAAEFNRTEEGVVANALYSGTAIHSIPITMNLLSNALIKSIAGDQYSIEFSRQQLPTSLSQSRLTTIEADSLSRVVIFCAFFFPTVALFVVNPLQEISTTVKQLQRMTGVGAISYWLTMFCFDIIIFMASVCVIMLGFYLMDFILDIRLYYSEEIWIMTLVLFLFGINALLISYIFSFLNKSRNVIMTLLSIAPLGLVILQYLLHQVLHGFPKLKVLHQLQKVVLRLIPHVSLFHGQTAFFETAAKNARCRRLPNRLQEVVCYKMDPCCAFKCWDGVCENSEPYFGNFKDDINLETSVVYLALTPLLYFAILILLEERVFARLIAKMLGRGLRSACDTMDEEVKKEKHAVAVEINQINSRASGKVQLSTITSKESESPQDNENESNSLFLVYELSKYYGKLVAVKEINFRVKQKECFGLLGVNGAGKSTTFRMLTGEEIPNSGNMYLKQWEIRSNRKNYLAEMGYCPQTDALLNSMNTFDHLRLFGLLRGVPRSKIDLEINKWINRLNLNACMHQPSGTYSGGNKRRLNIAMSLIGNPTLVLLDEPTTGVDPAARRSLWTVLQSCQAAGQAIILTSHSMEECEALCNRLVIMVKGQLVCVGASQELKQRFGAGYDIQIKVNPSRSDDDVTKIKEKIQASLTCEITDENLGYIAYHVTDPGTTWVRMYGTMANLKNEYSCIEDYAVLSATLEQLFLQFARGVETSTIERLETPRNSTSQPISV